MKNKSAPAPTEEPEIEADDAPDEAEAIEEASPLELKADTLAGDLRDAILMQIRSLRRPWEQLSESEQRGVANIVEASTKTLVRSAVRVLTDVDIPRCVVTLGEVKIKGEKGIEAKISCPNYESTRSILGEYVGEMVVMLMVDSEDFMNERAPVRIDPDQRAMPLDEVAEAAEPDEDDVPDREPAEQAPAEPELAPAE